jgi:putative OPT family oligopeptide transporter
MVVGGLWALVNLRKTLGFAFRAGVRSFRSVPEEKTLRTERDTPMKWVILGIGVMVIPLFIIYLREIHNVSITMFMAIIMVIAGFLFASVAGYMAGLVGSSNNPISGVTIATILTSSLILLALMGDDAAGGPVAAIMIGSVVACAAAIAGDNMQDLKAGYLLGATPFRQQMMQVAGVLAAALTLPFVLDVLNRGYGFGPRTVENPDALAAPQATLMQSVAEGVFGGNLPWNMVYIGMAIGIAVIVIDKILEIRSSEFRIPVLALAVGLYLPFELDSAIMLGGLMAWLINILQRRKKVKNRKQAENRSNQSGLLFASGLITGEALIGIILAIPVAIYESSDVLALTDGDVSSLPGVMVTMLVCFILVYMAIRAYSDKTLK